MHIYLFILNLFSPNLEVICDEQLMSILNILIWDILQIKMLNYVLGTCDNKELFEGDSTKDY